MKYSIIVPIFNDGYLAEAFCKEALAVFRRVLGTQDISDDVELIFINDGSSDNSLSLLIELFGSYNFLRVIDLSRNFGQHQAIACGFREAVGQIIIRSNVDMQDPLSELPKLLSIVEINDIDLAIGQYEQRNSPIKDKITSALFFMVFRLMSGLDVPHNTSPLRAMNRRFINAYNTLTERSRFPQGLDQWLGFRHALVPIEHVARADKRSSYTMAKRLRLAVNGMIYFSDRPIKIVTMIGLILGCLGSLIGIWLVISKLLGAEYQPGFTSLAAIGLIAFGIQLTSLGVVGMYVGKIFSEVQNRPLYLIRESYSREQR